MTGSSYRWVGAGVAVLLTAGIAAVGQGFSLGSQQTRSSSATGSASTPVLRTVSGRVINALTGAAVPRALVNLNSRVMLTDAQGKFSFENFTESQGYVLINKPGFSQYADAAQGITQVRVTDLDAVQELRLYPEALVTGTLTGGDGLPLARVPMRIRRLTFDAYGPHWQPVGFSQTDGHGQYRFSVPAGRYRINSDFMQRSQETGEVILPVAFPSLTNGNHGEYLELKPGETQEINFRPRVGPGSPALLKLNMEEDERQRGVRLIATGSSGVTFRMQNMGRQDNEYRVELPPGTYSIRALLENRDDPQSGTARLTVTGHGIPEIPIQMSPASVFPVEMVVQASSTAAGGAVVTPPSVRNMNFSLRNEANDGNGEDNDVQITGRPDAPPELHVLPGRYRLAGGRFALWTVKAATCGTTDLLREDLVVGPGAGGTPIRIVVSNATGRIHGTVRLAGVPTTGWLYLVSTEPSLTPEIELVIQPDGTYRWIGAPGKYIAVPSDHQVREDFRDAKFLAKFTVGARTIEVTEGGDTLTDLSMGAVTP